MSVKNLPSPHMSWLNYLICVISLFEPHMPTEFVLSVCHGVLCLSNSTMGGHTATNHAMLPSLGQKVKCISFYSSYFTFTYSMLLPDYASYPNFV